MSNSGVFYRSDEVETKLRRALNEGERKCTLRLRDNGAGATRILLHHTEYAWALGQIIDALAREAIEEPIKRGDTGESARRIAKRVLCRYAKGESGRLYDAVAQEDAEQWAQHMALNAIWQETDAKTIKQVCSRTQEIDRDANTRWHWQIGARRMGELAQGGEKLWSKLKEATPWVAREAVETLDMETLCGKAQSWKSALARAAAPNVGTSNERIEKVIEAWRLSNTTPPLQLSVIWAARAKIPDSDDEWAGMIEAEREIVGRAPKKELGSGTFARSEMLGDSTANRLGKSMRRQACEVIMNESTEATPRPEVVLAELEDAWESAPATGTVGQALELDDYCEAHGWMWRPKAGWTLGATSAVNAIVSGRSLRALRRELKACTIAYIDAGDPEEGHILGWKNDAGIAEPNPIWPALEQALVKLGIT